MSTGSSGKRPAGGPPWRGRGYFFGGHHERQRYVDVGAPGADRAPAIGPVHEFAERIRQPAVDPVPDHNTSTEGGAGQELLGQRQW